MSHVLTVRSAAAVAVAAGLVTLGIGPGSAAVPDQGRASTATPIRHLVVIYDENISFDHYFGASPHAANPPGEPAFHAAAGTPSVNGLTAALLTANPNSANPQRLDRSEPLTCDQDHGYTAEQQAFDHGLMDKFVENAQNLDCSPPDVSKPGLVMVTTTATPSPRCGTTHSASR